MSNVLMRLRELPIDLVEGPARVLISMNEDTFYTVAELSEKSSLAKSTTARHLAKLTDLGVVRAVFSNNERGRPKHFYALATTTKETPSC